MKIHEYQAKEILKNYDVPVPIGYVTTKLSEVKDLVKKLPTKVSVVKAQIHAGGRGKGGGVKVAKSLKEAEKSGYWENSIVTEITKLNNYTDAEDYHDNYYDNNPNQPYCLFVIRPKLNKLQRDGIID